ncbi:unnamed protein product [Mytilus edulis]|uniref:RNase H type-1 domain-containing protein n=1 Tax=Mytilus edulis TaxID=6550 RepID=A0A8S3PR22_MYTED|nr:unnamed protein product [Mytilus edulis]
MNSSFEVKSKFSLDNKSVSINSDNKNVPHILKVGSKKSILQNIAVDIHNICSEKNITLNSKWLPRADNQYADKLSRNTDNDDWGVNLRRNVEAALVESGVSENCNIYNLAGKMTTFLVDSRKTHQAKTPIIGLSQIKRVMGFNLRIVQFGLSRKKRGTRDQDLFSNLSKNEV